jgi:hypothetical protein
MASKSKTTKVETTKAEPELITTATKARWTKAKATKGKPELFIVNWNEAIDEFEVSFHDSLIVSLEGTELILEFTEAQLEELLDLMSKELAKRDASLGLEPPLGE